MVHRISIIGMGPKGFYCLERLLAYQAQDPIGEVLHIDVFNRFPYFGASPIYDPKQPDYILLNNSIADIDLWTADDPPISCGRGPNFIDWYQKKFSPSEPLRGDEYLSRAVVGRYLTEGFDRLVNNLPKGVDISCWVGEVLDIEHSGAQYQLKVLHEAGHTFSVVADKILLATGHSRLLPNAQERALHAFASRHPRAIFIPFVYPVMSRLRRIPAKSRVAMKGIGLTFIDAVLELTEGRGGAFHRSSDGELHYQPSGKEPERILPFSLTGLPMCPKAFDLPDEPRELTFFTPEALDKLKNQDAGGKLDFENDLLPLFELEMYFNYYRVVLRSHNDRRLEACDRNAETVKRIVESFLRLHPEERQFDYREILWPLPPGLTSAQQFVSFVREYLKVEIANARLGESACPIKAAIGIWYDVRRVLNFALQFGGLTPESHKKLIEYYYPLLKRVAFGPPIINAEKLLALVEANVIDFTAARNPSVVTDEASGCFVLQCKEFSDETNAEILIDARYPAGNIPRDATALYTNLGRRGAIRPFTNSQRAEPAGVYTPGAIDMTPQFRFVIDDHGDVNEDITVIGIPTEGNLAGNLTLVRDGYSSVWAKEVLTQLRQTESSLRASAHELNSSR